ncbi:MAG: hypothetical protein KBA97_00335 [Methanothrix sp.]|nr:hypothetical protein [Methanothrix sp.]
MLNALAGWQSKNEGGSIMVVRLQTAEGRIKKYQTTRVLFESYVEGFPIDKYVTKCGREWKPGTENQECDHLECAICLAEQLKEDLTGASIFLMVLAFAIIIIVGIKWPQRFDSALVYSGLLILSAFYFAFLRFRSAKSFKELTEYKYKGTINGIRAWQISGCPHTG